MSTCADNVLVGDVRLQSRLVMAPVKTAYGRPDGLVTDRHLAFWARRNKHLGAVIPEPFFIDPRLREHPLQIGAHSDDAIPGMARLARTIQANGAKAVAHLTHPGRMANPKLPDNVFLSSSDKPCPNGGKTPVGMDAEHVAEAKAAFARAAARAREAGFDVVELQFGHGHLVAQFLSPSVNDRADQYGGSLENRFRFGVEVLEAVKQACSLPVMIRISGGEMFPGGFELDEMVLFARELEKNGADALHISSGSICETPPWYFQHMAVPKGKTWEMAAAIKRRVDIPVMAVGKVSRREDVLRILENGMADLVAVCRPLVADPDFAAKVLGSDPAPVRPCTACLEGCVGGVRSGKGLMCVVNPMLGRDLEETAPARAEQRRKVAVVGGGPAGMEAALALNERGHAVTLYEKARLGGQFNLAHLGPRKAELKSLVDYYVDRVEREVAIVRQAPRAEDLIRSFDAVVLATGSAPVALPIEGLDQWAGAEVLLPEHTFSNKNVVVLGGGLVGIEVAEHLARNRNTVTIVEKLEEIAANMEMMAGNLARKALAELGVTVLTRAELLKKEGARLVVRQDGREVVLEGVDQVVVTVGMKPLDELETELAGRVETHKIGDCGKVGKVMDAIQSAHLCASRL